MRKRSDRAPRDQEHEDSPSDLRELRGIALGTLRELLERCAARAEQLGPDSFDRDLCIASGQLAKTVVSLEAEDRQAKRAARAAMEELSTQRILAYLRQATTSERKTVLRELQVIEGGGGVLG